MRTRAQRHADSKRTEGMYVRPNIARMQAYLPGEQPTESAWVKLNTNENPYPPSPEVAKAILAEAAGELNQYPDPMADAVRERLATRFSLARENFLVGNGGDDILTIVTRSIAGEKDLVAYPSPTYILYETLAELQAAKIHEVPYGPDFAIPEALFGSGARLTFLANPNSPSGTAVPVKQIKRLADSLDGALLVDEAYADFADDTAMRLVGRAANLCVLRSFSKSFSLAGLRVGYLAGPVELVSQFAKAKDSYNVNRLSMAAAAAALDDYDYMLENVERIRRSRCELTEALDELGFSSLPSQANFIWTKVPSPGARSLYEKLKSRKILVRFWDRPAMSDYVRITVGTDKQVELFLSTVREIIGAQDV